MSWEKLRNYYTHFRHKIVWNELYDKLPLSDSWMFSCKENFDKILNKDPFQIIFLESHEKKDFILLMNDLTSDYMYRLKSVKDAINHPLSRIIYEYLFGETKKGETKDYSKVVVPERKSSDRICDIYLSKVLNIKLVMKNPIDCDHEPDCCSAHEDQWCDEHGYFLCDIGDCEYEQEELESERENCDDCKRVRNCSWEYSYSRSRCDCMGYKYIWNTDGYLDEDWICRRKDEIMGYLEYC